jgi:predicted MFS family arabinose efflux permease
MSNTSGANSAAIDSGQVASPSIASNPWLAVTSVALSATVFCTTEFMPVGLLRYISQGLEVTPGMAGVMVTVPGVLAAIAAPFLTVAVGSRDRRTVLLALGTLLLASNIVAMLASSFAILILGRVLFGIGLGGFWAIGAGIGTRLVPAASVGKATSLIFAGVSVGMLIGGAAGALIGDQVGWRAAFGVSAALSALGLLAQFIWLPSLKVDERIRTRDLFGILATRPGRVGLLAMALALCGQFATYTFVTPFLASQSGFDGKVISSILLGYTLIGIIGNFIGGTMATRSIKATLLVTIALFAVSVLLLPEFAHEQVVALMLLALWGLAYGAMPVALQMWMVRSAPNAHEGAMALFVANFQESIALGSFVGGSIVDRLGIQSAMYFGGAVAIAALMVLWRAPEESGAQP